MPKNIVKVFGGLGNQMFQYAFQLYLEKQGRPSRISFSNFFSIHYHQGFDLGRAFKLKVPLWQHILSFVLVHFSFAYRVRYLGFPVRRFAMLVNKRHKNVFREKNFFVFDPSAAQHPPSLFIGTWQAVDYLEGQRELLLSNFTFKKNAGALNKRFAMLIGSVNSVSIHIRRGDYLEDRWKNSHAIFDDLSYYKEAINIINRKVENPIFFIFSDDPEWARENLQLIGAHYVTHNRGKNSYRDMLLMSLCKHNIIANSTFSWWGAWLNQNPEKTVIMPKPWLRDVECNGIYVKGWTTLPIIENDSRQIAVKDYIADIKIN